MYVVNKTIARLEGGYVENEEAELCLIRPIVIKESDRPKIGVMGRNKRYNPLKNCV